MIDIIIILFNFNTFLIINFDIRMNINKKKIKEFSSFLNPYFYFVIHFTKSKLAGSNSISCFGITLNV